VSAPLVSVMMPAFNHERFVARAVESVWNQTHSNIELLVIDDGSTDRTLEVLRMLAKESPVPMRIETQSNQGIAATLNRLIDQARGEWLTLLSSDDYYAPEFIERNLAEVERLGRDDIVLHSNAFLVEANDRVTGIFSEIATTRPLQGQAFDLVVSGGGHMIPCTMFVRRALLVEAGGFDPTMVAEDADLQLRLARRAEFHYIDEPIFYSRYTPGSLGKKPWLWGDSIIRAIEKHEDILGPRLPVLLSKASENIAAACFEQGETRTGVRWAREALRQAPGRAAKTKVFGRLVRRLSRAAARSAAIRLFGRERLVRVKRRLFPAQREAAGTSAAKASLSSERTPELTNGSPK
jgi:glycosyltransferase involved in cell wall biosynthesis